MQKEPATANLQIKHETDKYLLENLLSQTEKCFFYALRAEIHNNLLENLWSLTALK